MIRDTYDLILNNIEVRQNLSKLRQELKEGNNKEALKYYMAEQNDIFPQLLSHEDAKTRKNTALVMGDLATNSYLDLLFGAYEMETTMFVKSSYLTALKEFNFIKYLPDLKKHLKELSHMELTIENKKHIEEQMRKLTELIVMVEGVKKRNFTGYKKKAQVLLLTNRNHKEITLEQLSDMKAKTFNAGVMVETNDLEKVLSIRTYTEMLFMINGMKTCDMDVENAASTIVNSEFLKFLTERHDGKAPFYFRLEFKSKMDLDKKSAFTKKLASEIERLSSRQLINSTSNYEVEIRLIENKDRRLNLLIKLFTIADERFSYRQNVVSASIKPVNAALTVHLVKDYLKEEAKILDPFCGVGTMLIERHKFSKANTMYGMDLYSDAIEKARENTELAHQIIHYLNKDFFDFTHEYLFDEIFTNMPMAAGKGKLNEIETLYRRFFKKAGEHLFENGIIVMYTHNIDFARTYAKANGFKVQEVFEISKVEDCFVAVFRK